MLVFNDLQACTCQVIGVEELGRGPALSKREAISVSARHTALLSRCCQDLGIMQVSELAMMSSKVCRGWALPVCLELAALHIWLNLVVAHKAHEGHLHPAGMARLQ